MLCIVVVVHTHLCDIYNFCRQARRLSGPPTARRTEQTVAAVVLSGSVTLVSRLFSLAFRHPSHNILKSIKNIN